MNLVGNLSQAVDVLVETSTALPSVRLVVLDDWCAHSGRIPVDRINDMSTLGSSLGDDISLVLISKAGINAGDSPSDLTVRGKEKMQAAGFQIWTLTRKQDGPKRTVGINDQLIECRIDDEGFVED
jgi:hypothetical protein